jgi:hypothetical protein
VEESDLRGRGFRLGVMTLKIGGRAEVGRETRCGSGGRRGVTGWRIIADGGGGAPS